MWFKNIKIFQLSQPIAAEPEILARKLEELPFKPCSAAMPMSLGFVAPLDSEHAPLVHAVMGTMLICLNIEEKILPITVVRQQAKDRVKELEHLEDRQLSKREKLSIQDQMYFSLIQQAFSRRTKIYAYFDLKNQWMIVDTNNAKKVELLISNLKKVLGPIEFISPTTKNIPQLVSRWLLSGQYPPIFEIEKHCKLEDFNNKNRVIACRNQDLFNDNIQNLIKDGCIPKQITLTWQERVTFNLNDNFTLSSLRYADSLIEEAKQDGGESEVEQFDADYFMMTQTIQALVAELLEFFSSEAVEIETTNITD